MKLNHYLKKFLKSYLIFIGIVSHFVVFIGVWYVTFYMGYSPSEYLHKGIRKIEDKSANLVSSVMPSLDVNSELDGNIKKEHPRILLPSLASWDGEGMPDLIKARLQKYNGLDKKLTDPCGVRGILNMASCWVSTGNQQVAQNLLSELLSYKLVEPKAEGEYGNAAAFVLAYDLLRTYKGLNDNYISQIEKKIEVALKQYLLLLDGYSASLWHGRTTLASIAWLCAVVLEPNNDIKNSLILRAQSHFLNVIKAVELTEAWPEGYNYWIQSRAFLFVLAASGYINGIENSKNASRIKKILERVGYWHIYATRPDNRIEGFGDEGSRVDLKDETRRVIDLIAQITRNKLLAKYSLYIRSLYPRESYYYEYRWGFRLLNDPELLTDNSPIKDLNFLNGLLPSVNVFGKGAMNLFYIHSDWGKDSTFISFKSGDNFTHHGHYDAGHFTIYKGSPLGINSSVYADFLSENRLNYSIRTIAKNSLLILRPGEIVKPNKFFAKNVADGGQRITMPTGSGIISVDDWKNNIDSGKHYEGGKLINYDHSEGDYTYIATDLTRAYNNTMFSDDGNEAKVKKVLRYLMYLEDYDQLIVFDHVESTNSAYIKKWLLHSVEKPIVSNEKVLKGVKDNGIMESTSKTALIKNGDSNLYVQKIYPENAKIRVVGGKDYQYYVEIDSDEKEFDGINYLKGSIIKPWFDVGFWRLEIQPEFPHLVDDFLVVLTPSIGLRNIDHIKNVITLTGNAKAITMYDKKTIVFISDTEDRKLEMLLTGNEKELYFMGLPANIDVKLKSTNYEISINSNANGVAKLSLDKKIFLEGSNETKLTINW